MSSKTFLLAALLLAPLAWAFTVSQDEKPKTQQCQAMADRHQKMASQMKEMDQALEKKLEAMRKASSDDKLQAVADLAEELATQRLEMHERMMEMHQGGMAHMMQHMSTEDGQKKMGQCPMIKSMMSHRTKDDGR